MNIRLKKKNIHVETKRKMPDQSFISPQKCVLIKRATD